MEICVGNSHLKQIIGACYDFAGGPRQADLSLARPAILRFLNALDERDGLLDARAKVRDIPLGVRVLRRHLARKPSSRTLDVVAGTLDLIDEWLLVGREST